MSNSSGAVTVATMLPSLSHLRYGDVCRPCTTPTDAELDSWDEREEKLTTEELARIPEGVNDSRAECAICSEELRDEVDGSTAVIVAVDRSASCGHAFHKTCLNRWFDQQVRAAGTLTCPVCRQPFVDIKVDHLYRRVNGERPPPEPVRAGRASQFPRHPIEEYPTLWEEAYGWELIWTAIPERVVIPIAAAQRADWIEVTHDAFCRKFGINPERLTLEVWTNILTQPANRQNWWLSYHRLVADLRSLATDVPAIARGVTDSARALAQDVNQARAQGASWSEVVRALVIGE